MIGSINLLKYLVVFITGMTPILEIRGAIPLGVSEWLGKLSYFESFIIGFLGNIVPIFFIVKYIRPIFDFLGRFKPFKIVIDYATNKATHKIEQNKKLQNFTLIGLFLFVAVPIPSTGAWVGSLIANFLNIPVKKAFWPLAAGVFVAGLIVLIITVVAQGSIEAIFTK